MAMDPVIGGNRHEILGIGELYKQRSMAVLGNSVTNHGWYWQTMLEQRATGGHDFPNEVSTGTVTSVTDETGGALEMTTTAGANRYASKRGQQTIVAAFGPTQRIYCVARIKDTVVPTVANHLSVVGTRANTLATVLEDYFMAGFIGTTHHGLAGVDTKYNLCVSDGTTVQIVRSSVTRDLNYHIIECWWDGALPYLCVDGEAPVPGAATPIPNAATYPMWGLRNGGAAEDHTSRIEWAGWGWRQI